MGAPKVSVKVITWEGYPTVEKAASLRQELLAALEKHAQVVLSLSLLDGMDISVLQLLRSAYLEAKKRGKTFHLTGTVKGDLARILAVSGFVRQKTDNARELEVELFGPELSGSEAQ